MERETSRHPTSGWLPGRAEAYAGRGTVARLVRAGSFSQARDLGRKDRTLFPMGRRPRSAAAGGIGFNAPARGSRRRSPARSRRRRSAGPTTWTGPGRSAVWVRWMCSRRADAGPKDRTFSVVGHWFQCPGPRVRAGGRPGPGPSASACRSPRPESGWRLPGCRRPRAPTSGRSGGRNRGGPVKRKFKRFPRHGQEA
jgi:hypothetical protein